MRKSSIAAAVAVVAVWLVGCGASGPPRSVCTFAQDARALASTVDSETAKAGFDKSSLLARLEQFANRAQQLSKQHFSDTDVSDDISSINDDVTNVITDVKGGFSGTALPSDKQDVADIKTDADTLKLDAQC
jgi:hypothetical protein